MKNFILAGIAVATWTTPQGDIAGYSLSYGRCNAARTALYNVKGVIQTTANTATVHKLALGAWCFQVIAIGPTGLLSPPSNVAVKVIT
jgi:hypothetical protein